MKKKRFHFANESYWIWITFSDVIQTCRNFVDEKIEFKSHRFFRYTRVEFDIIEVAESTCNKSPVIYSDHHLALEKWCVPHLYEYAYGKMLNFKKQSTYNRTGILFEKI